MSGIDAREFELDGGERFEHVATFQAFLVAWGSEAKSNQLYLKMGIPEEFKYLALPVTDKPGRAMEVSVSIMVFDGFDTDGDDEVDGDGG